jgi:hypothetical protein
MFSCGDDGNIFSYHVNFEEDGDYITPQRKLTASHRLVSLNNFFLFGVSKGYFCDGTSFRKFFLSRMHAKRRFGTFFPCLEVTNTSSLTEFWVTVCVPEPTFLTKVAMVLV